MFQTFALKMCPLVFVAVLGACGGGEDDTPAHEQQTVLHPPENVTCQTTVPIPPDCILTHK